MYSYITKKNIKNLLPKNKFIKKMIYFCSQY